MSHLNALELRLSNERNYLVEAKTKSKKALRRAWIVQVEKEIKSEREFLGLDAATDVDLSDGDLLAALGI